MQFLASQWPSVQWRTLLLLLCRRYVFARCVLHVPCALTCLCVFCARSQALRALIEFLQAHEHDWFLNRTAMARLSGELLPAAQAAWPALQDVLETEINYTTVFGWTAERQFARPLDRYQVFALTQLLMLQVCTD